MKRFVLAAILLAASGIAAAQNLLTNGSFEAGLASWTLTESAPGDCVFQALSPPSNTGGFGAFPTQAPTDGAATLMSDANSPVDCLLTQDVVLATGGATLSYAAGYNYAAAGLPGTGVGCLAQVSIATTGGVPIATGYTRTGATNQAMAPRPPLSVSLAPGTTVRVTIHTVACADGPAGIAADNFVLLAAAGAANNVPTLSEWAMLLLALLMSGSALVALRRRRIRT